MSLYQQAARLNNEGVSSLLSENYQRTVEVLANSIKTMKQELSKAGANMNESQSSSSSSSSSSSYGMSTVELPAFNQQRSAYIFNQAFQIREDKNEGDINIAVAAIIFNLALTHHRQYLNNKDESVDQEKSMQCLMKAEKLYSMTIKILKKPSSYQNSRMGLIIKMACVNNLSSIHSDSCYDVISEVVQSLSHFMSSMEVADDCANNKLFEETKFQALLMNVLLLKAPKVAPAA